MLEDHCVSLPSGLPGGGVTCSYRCSLEWLDRHVRDQYGCGQLKPIRSRGKRWTRQTTDTDRSPRGMEWIWRVFRRRALQTASKLSKNALPVRTSRSRSLKTRPRSACVLLGPANPFGSGCSRTRRSIWASIPTHNTTTPTPSKRT